MNILNLYAGVGGNRKYWSSAKHSITAVEWNEEIAEEYMRLHPNDNIVIGDAHEFLKENYQDFDFIWASPPCPSHSGIRKAGARNNQYDAKYPDMKLWQEIIFLKNYCDVPWVVENVKPYYAKDVNYDKSDLFVNPQEKGRHYFWSNLNIPSVDVPKQNIGEGNKEEWREYVGLDVKKDWETVEERKVLRNCVHPKIGKAILEAAESSSFRTKQQTLEL